MTIKKIVLLFIFFLGVNGAFAQQFPEKSNTLVTDYTNTLTAEQKSALESKLVAFDDSTSTQIAVVIIKSVGGYDIDQYGTQLGRKWGIGNQGKNNGILLLVALDDHKLTIQTGYGTEGGVPDITAHQIIENDITPQFKQGKYYEGLDAGTNSLISYMKGEYKQTKAKNTQANSQGQEDSGGGIGFGVFIIVIIIIIIIRSIGRGGGGQVIGGRGGSGLGWFFLGSMLGGGGGSRGGGFFGGGSGGGGGGGGFGGFGGGSFGGGGSSGSW